MDCLLHQVLVAMLTVTPAADAPATANGAEIQRRAAVSLPAKAGQPAVVLGKKSRNGTQVAQVTVPRGGVN